MRVRLPVFKLPPVEAAGSRGHAIVRAMKAILYRQLEESRSLTWQEFLELKRLYKSLRLQIQIHGRWYDSAPSRFPSREMPTRAPCMVVHRATFDLMIHETRVIKAVPESWEKKVKVVAP